MTVKDLLASLVRTAVPALVGFVLAFAARKWGVVLSDDTSAQVSMIAVSVAGSAYYAVVRFAEARWAWAGWLLGWNLPPTYSDPAKPVE